MDISFFDNNSEYSREILLLQMKIKNLKREDEKREKENYILKMQMKTYHNNFMIVERKNQKLQKENKKIKNKLRPNLFKRLFNKFI